MSMVVHGPPLVFTQGRKRPETRIPSGQSSDRPAKTAEIQQFFHVVSILLTDEVSTYLSNPPSIPHPIPALGKDYNYRYRQKGSAELIMGYLFKQRLCHCKIQSLPRGPQASNTGHIHIAPQRLSKGATEGARNIQGSTIAYL